MFGWATKSLPRTRRKSYKRKPARRYVYLMERTTGRTLLTVVTLRREIKIGVAHDLDQRLEQVANGIPGTIVLIYWKQLDRATTIEAELHRRFSRHNFRPKGARYGAGRSEFFRLTNAQIREAKRALNKREEALQDWIFFFIAVILIAAYVIAKTSTNG